MNVTWVTFYQNEDINIRNWGRWGHRVSKKAKYRHEKKLCVG